MSTLYILPLLIGFLCFVLIITTRTYLEKATRISVLEERLKSITGNSLLTAKVRSKSMLLQRQRQSILEKNFSAHLKPTMNLTKRLKNKFFYSPVKIPLWKVLGIGYLVFYLTSTLTDYILRQGEVVNYGAGLLVTAVIIVLYTDFVKARREKEFSRNFALALDIIIRGLKAGISIERTFGTVAKEIRGPVGSEFQRIIQHINFGVTFQEALKEAAERVNSDDFNFFVIALTIQRKIGGSIADLIGNIRVVIRQRHELRLKIEALSSEAKASGLIVGLLPVLLLVLSAYLTPDYLSFFQEDPTGQKLILIALGLIVSGAYIIKKITRFEV